ncbi:MAG: 23S rRNA (adenine(2030)-N(6))-methyltransferase RlmJ [Verrucomicrobia bacterium]|nr:23S rRNA (adenine(2030)-N(6))-methyltransferase RlmJ [Verrucomicrobiota bacterium]
MNYRHRFHAGNFADVMKHALLVRLVHAMQKKDQGFLYLDTHAGRGSYDLAAAAAGDSRARKPEWPDGIGRLWTGAAVPEVVAEYVGLTREFDRQKGNLEEAGRFYPGSPWFARRLARPQDRLAMCEKHPTECATLRAETGSVPRVSIDEMDGYVALRALLPPRERRALVLIDPPFEAQGEFAQIAVALGEALRRFPSGVFVVWYPLTERARVNAFFAAAIALRPPPTLVAELAIAGEMAGLKMRGCGLVVINPPWQIEREARAVLGYLAGALAQAAGGGGRVEWLIPE